MGKKIGKKGRIASTTGGVYDRGGPEMALAVGRLQPAPLPQFPAVSFVVVAFIIIISIFFVVIFI